MFAIRSLKLKVLGLAAAVVLTGGASSAAPPKGSHGANGVSGATGAFKPQGSPQPSGGNTPKIDLGVNKVGNNLPKIDPGIGNGIKPANGGNGPKIDPGKGNGPINGNGPKIDPGKGNGPFGNGMANKPWLQKPGNGMDKTIFCKTPCPKDYCSKFGVKCSFGYCYKGFDHCHWHCRRYSDLYGCWFFYDPCCLAWYYWCETDVCYYPVTYVPYKTFCCSAPVTTVAAAPIVTTPVVTTYYVPTYYYVRPTYYVVPSTYYVTTPVVAAGAPAPVGGAAPAGGGMALPPLPGE